MRAITVSAPRLARLTSVLTLLDEVEAGGLDLTSAARRLRAIEDAPAQSLTYARAAILLSVACWVVFLKSNDLLAVLVAVLAMSLTFPVDTLVGRLRMPTVFGTFLAAAILAAVPNLLAGGRTQVRGGPGRRRRTVCLPAGTSHRLQRDRLALRRAGLVDRARLRSPPHRRRPGARHPRRQQDRAPASASTRLPIRPPRTSPPP